MISGGAWWWSQEVPPGEYIFGGQGGLDLSGLNNIFTYARA